MTINGLKHMARHLSSLLLTHHPRPLKFSAPPIPNKSGLFPTRPITFCHHHEPPPAPRLSSVATMSTTTTATTSDPSHLDAIINQKKALRTKVRRALKSMDPLLRSQEDETIQNLVLEAPWFKSSERLCAYLSCSALREVATSKLLHEILNLSFKDDNLQMRKTLYVPRVEDKNSNMRMLNITSMNDLIPNSMNILEPSPTDMDGNEREDVLLADDPVDLLLLPGLAFDKAGRRLGRGGGYYDTFLTRYLERAKQKKWKQPLLVALSYSVQIMGEDIVPVTPSDVLIDAIVSPSGVIPASAAAKARCQ